LSAHDLRVRGHLPCPGRQPYRRPMPGEELSYDKLTDMARLCWRQARLTQDKDVAALFRKMATEFQQAAAKFDGGKLPDLGEHSDETPIV
jgi:hypothetical protein